jgi:hypothetical protein
VKVVRKIGLCMIAVVFFSMPAHADRVERTMKIHRLSELGLEIWTEFKPLWITEVHYQGIKPVFTAQTPPMVYPPAAMKVVSFPGMSVAPEEMKDIATTAISEGARNYKTSKKQLNDLHIIPAAYGDLSGYEADFNGKVHGDAVDVKVFVGNKEGKGPVMLQIYTLEGKMDHLSEQIRRSWTNVRYLN